jgi:hypothetical protein
MVDYPDRTFRYYLLGIVAANLIVSYLVETFMIPCIATSWTNRRNRNLREKIKQEKIAYSLHQLHRTKVGNK